MNNFYQIRISNIAAGYYETFGKWPYIVHRLIQELGNQCIDLPNYRTVNISECSRIKIPVTSRTFANLVNDNPYSDISLTRVVEAGMAMAIPVQNNWPIAPSIAYQKAYVALTSLSPEELKDLEDIL